MIAFKRAGRAAAAAVLAGCLLVTVSSRGESKSAQPTTVRGITKPSAVYDKLQLINPGLVREVKVKEGDRVKKGQLLIAEDDRVEVNEFKQLDIQAKSNVGIDLYKTEMDIKKVQLKNVQEGGSDFNPSEVDEKTLAVDEAKGHMEVAKLEQDGYGLKALGQLIKVEQMKLVSPADGVVTVLNIHEGEMSAPNAKDPPIVIVQNDPLWAEFQLPTAQSSHLKFGDKLDVRHENDGQDQWVGGKVIFINPQANSSSDTQTVRVEVPNPKNRDSGMHVFLKLPDEIANPSVAKAPSP